MALVSCSEGQYWDEASTEDLGNAVAFQKSAETVSIEADGTFPSVYYVTVGRSNAANALTVPVTFESESTLLSGPESVTFEAGSLSAEYPISIGSGAKAGLNYSCTLTLSPDDTILQANENNLTFTFKISQVLVLKWESRGVASAMSSWAGNEDLIDIPVEEATNYPVDGMRLMRLVSPYWLLEPQYAVEGYNIEYFLDGDGNALSMAADWQFIGETDDSYGYFFFGCPAAYGSYFMNQESIFVMSGIMGYSGSLSGQVTAGWYETIQFIWSDYGK